MLRTIRLRLAFRPTSIPQRHAHIPYRRCASSVTKPDTVQDESESSLYGNDYGSGPSRIPFNAANSVLSGDTGLIIKSYTAKGKSKSLRRYLNSVQGRGQYANPDIFSGHMRSYLPGSLPPAEMSRLDLHTTIHHLIRAEQPTLATALLAAAIQDGNARHPRVRRLVRKRTLKQILKLHAERISSNIADKSYSKSCNAAMRSLSDLVAALQSIRHPRPSLLYHVLIRACINLRRPDRAAEVFVGLVEEWVTEGRVAEGADIDAFHEGGGLPAKRKDANYGQNKSWWIGVRDWSFPGEVISPHDRLDLWHPTKLSLGEKLRNFPFPVVTSPPSGVPFPSNDLMAIIISSLRLDPKVANREDFEASMRACAILANTVLSRTLPVTVLGPLLKAFESSPSIPAVYPVHMVTPPTENAWAYQAYTQVHLALQSFLFSPPISAASFARARAQQTIISGTLQVDQAHRYRLQPLSFSECVTLVRYALEKVRCPPILTRLMGYLKHSFGLGRTLPHFWNTLLIGGTHLGDAKIAKAADDALFGRTPFARSDLQPSDESSGGKEQQSSQEGTIQSILPIARLQKVDSVGSKWTPRDLQLDIPEPSVLPLANERSIIALIYNLGRTSQFDRLKDLTYTLIPFLAESHQYPSEGPEMDESIAAEQEASPSSTGRTPPTPLTPGIYSALLTSLALCNKLSLGQRVYTLALQAESKWLEDHRIAHPNHQLPLPKASRLPIQCFTAMMKLWAIEVGRCLPTEGMRVTYAAHYKRPKEFSSIPAHKVASLMALRTYADASERWIAAKDLVSGSAWYRKPKAPMEQVPPSFRPGPDFFHYSLQALAPCLELHDHRPFRTRTAGRDLDTLVNDMQNFGVVVPRRVKQRLEGRRYGEFGGALVPAEYSVLAAAAAARSVLPAKMSKVEGEDAQEMVRDVALRMLRTEREGVWRDKEVREMERADAAEINLGEVEEAQLI